MASKTATASRRGNIPPIFKTAAPECDPGVWIIMEYVSGKITCFPKLSVDDAKGAKETYDRINYEHVKSVRIATEIV